MTADRPVTGNFTLLDQQLRALIGDETDALANAANFVALLFNALDDVNWLGLYIRRDNELVLGPFQGLPACIRLPMGQGVCGNAALSQKTIRVADVNAYSGHIACDSASQSEMVVPLIVAGRLVGVLDIDSPSLNRFGASDQQAIEKLCASFCERAAVTGFVT